MTVRPLLLAATLLAAPIAAQPADGFVPTPAALIADGTPPVPLGLRDATQAYMEFRTASFS